MRIAFLSHTADIRGGGERSLIELIRHCEVDLGCSVSLICPGGPLQEEVGRNTEVNVYTLPFTIMRRTSNPIRLLSYGGRYTWAVLRLRELLRRAAPDILHANSAPAALYGGLAAAGTGIPVIWHMRDIQPRALTFRFVLPVIGRLASHVVAISGAVRENLVEFGIPASKISVVYNAVRPQPGGGGAAFRRQHHIPSSAVVFAVVGEMLHRKGQLAAVRAFAALEQGSGHLVLCGGNLESEYGAAVLAEVKAQGIQERVTVTGFMVDPSAVFDAMDVLLVPSNQEPFGRVVAEGMFAKKAIVATRVGGLPELVRNRAEALLVTPGDEAAMAQAMQALSADPERRKAMGIRAYRRAEALFSWERRAAEGDMSAVYRAVTGAGVKGLRLP